MGPRKIAGTVSASKIQTMPHQSENLYSSAFFIRPVHLNCNTLAHFFIASCKEILGMVVEERENGSGEGGSSSRRRHRIHDLDLHYSQCGDSEAFALSTRALSSIVRSDVQQARAAVVKRFSRSRYGVRVN
jgi:hypothetical protein